YHGALMDVVAKAQHTLHEQRPQARVVSNSHALLAVIHTAFAAQPVLTSPGGIELDARDPEDDVAPKDPPRRLQAREPAQVDARSTLGLLRRGSDELATGAGEHLRRDVLQGCVGIQPDG